MVLVERSCRKCRATCEAADAVCSACGASLKITLPLDENGEAALTLLLTHHLQKTSLFKERYRIIRQVGVGGFGAVYEAEDTQEQRRVAIKEIGLAGLTPQQVIEATSSFNREVQMLSSLQHRSIPQMYAQLTDAEHWYLVMEFIAGTTLEESLVLAAASDDHIVRLWNVDSHPYWWRMLEFSLGFRTYSYGLHESSVKALCWSPDGDMIASAEERNAIHIWDARTREPILIYRGHSDNIEDVAWSPDRLRIASSSLDHTTRIWSSVDGRNLWHWRPKSGAIVHALAWSPDARYLAGGTSDGKVHVWDTLYDRQVYIYRGHKGAVSCVAWSPDGQRLASASFDGTVHLWRVLDGKDPFIYSHYEKASLLTVAWSPDGQHLASAGLDAEVHVWKAV
jgi:dipeptidyl aminopeptidase/acylaminoacyl peptidase